MDIPSDHWIDSSEKVICLLTLAFSNEWCVETALLEATSILSNWQIFLFQLEKLFQLLCSNVLGEVFFKEGDFEGFPGSISQFYSDLSSFPPVMSFIFQEEDGTVDPISIIHLKVFKDDLQIFYPFFSYSWVGSAMELGRVKFQKSFLDGLMSIFARLGVLKINEALDLSVLVSDEGSEILNRTRLLESRTINTLSASPSKRHFPILSR